MGHTETLEVAAGWQKSVGLKVRQVKVPKTVQDGKSKQIIDRLMVCVCVHLCMHVRVRVCIHVGIHVGIH